MLNFRGVSFSIVFCAFPLYIDDSVRINLSLGLREVPSNTEQLWMNTSINLCPFGGFSIYNNHQQPPTTTNIKDPADAMNEPVAKYSTLAENV